MFDYINALLRTASVIKERSMRLLETRNVYYTFIVGFCFWRQFRTAAVLLIFFCIKSYFEGLYRRVVFRIEFFANGYSLRSKNSMWFTIIHELWAIKKIIYCKNVLMTFNRHWFFRKTYIGLVSIVLYTTKP